VTSQPDLTAVRDHIDAIDRQMVSLIAERQRWVAATLYDTAVLVQERVSGPIPHPLAEEMLREYAALGATTPEYQPGETWRVMLDPAGHPFCLCAC